MSFYLVSYECFRKTTWKSSEAAFSVSPISKAEVYLCYVIQFGVILILSQDEICISLETTLGVSTNITAEV